MINLELSPNVNATSQIVSSKFGSAVHFPENWANLMSGSEEQKKMRNELKEELKKELRQELKAELMKEIGGELRTDITNQVKIEIVKSLVESLGNNKN